MDLIPANNKKTLWIVDFDYMLFDLYRFMDEFKAMLVEEFGVPGKTYDETKARLQRRTLYHFEEHLRVMEKALGLPPKLMVRKAMPRINALFSRADRYFFRDAIPFMRQIAKRDEVILLSYGHAAHQRRKVRASGLEAYCDRIIFTPTKKGKAQWVKKLATRGRRVMIVNDDPGETRMMAAALRKSSADLSASRVILVERPEGKYFPIPPHKDCEVVRRLGDIFKKRRTP